MVGKVNGKVGYKRGSAEVGAVLKYYMFFLEKRVPWDYDS